MAENKPTRFIGLDVHKFYLIAIGVDAERQQVYGPQCVTLNRGLRHQRNIFWR